MVVIAKCLATEPRILILDEPTRDTGVAAKAILEGSEASQETIMSAALIADDTGART